MACMSSGIETNDRDVPVELFARIVLDGNRYIATVDQLPLEGMGNTRVAAENALVQVVRAWLERQDTAGRLADALGMDDLDEETEIVLQFINNGGEDDPVAALPQ